MMAYMAPFFKAIQNNTALQAELKTLGLFQIHVNSTSNDTETFLVGDKDIHKLQLVCILGTDATRKSIENHWKKVVATVHRYTNAVGPDNKYATATHMGEDKTPASGPVALDVKLIDEDTINVIPAAFPDNTLDEVAEDDYTFGQFFTSLEHGRRVVTCHMAGIPFIYGEDDINEEIENIDEIEGSDDDDIEDSDDENDMIDEEEGIDNEEEELDEETDEEDDFNEDEEDDDAEDDSDDADNGGDTDDEDHDFVLLGSASNMAVEAGN